MTSVDWNNTEIPRDRWGRPMILPAKGGKNAKRVPYRRCTTYVGCLDDTFGLMQWKSRQVALGMGQRKDLVLAAAAARPEDKKTLNEIVDKATEQAQGSSAATTGTALHSFTERIDRGEPLGTVPDEYKADLEAYKAATAGIEWLGIETFRVHDEWQVAGTADRIGKLNGRTMIMDIKTGSIDYPHKMSMQLAMYARMTPYDIATDTRTADPEPVDLHYGVIIHLPAGKGECTLFEIDIIKGWGACIIAKSVWSWRGTKDLTRPISTDMVDAGPPTWESLALAATTVEDIRLIWNRANECGNMTDDLNALLTQRAAAIKAAS